MADCDFLSEPLTMLQALSWFQEVQRQRQDAKRGIDYTEILEKQNDLLEQIARALQYRNEQEYHTVR